MATESAACEEHIRHGPMARTFVLLCGCACARAAGVRQDHFIYSLSSATLRMQNVLVTQCVPVSVRCAPCALSALRCTLHLIWRAFLCSASGCSISSCAVILQATKSSLSCSCTLPYLARTMCVLRHWALRAAHCV